MELKSVKCKSCGANIQYDNTKKSGFCEFCGTLYTVNRGRSYNTDNNYFNLARRGLEFLEVNEIDSADECFNKILENDDYCAAYAGKVAVEMMRNSNDKKMMYYVNKVIETFDCISSEEKETVIKFLNLQGAHGCIPLHTAAYYAQFDEVKFLLENGSNVNAKSDALATPLFSATFQSKSKANKNAPKVVRLLLDYGADESVRGENGIGIINSTTSDEVIDVIKELRPNADLSIKNAKTTGCYIATAVYGSYNCPAVWTLRRYRDNILKGTWYGRAFIKVYYAISPTFVKIFGQTLWFNKFFKSKLDKLVGKLQDNGVECSPYWDLNK